MDLVERLSLSNGAEARLFKDGIGWRFELEEAGNVYADRYDPRDDDGTLVVAPTRWTRPDGAPTTPSVHDAIIDAFWKLAEKTAAVERILEWRPDLQCNIARRWALPEGGFLARVATPASAVEYLELDRTAWLQYTRAGERVARLDETGGRWKFPADAALDPSDAARIAARLRNAAPGDMVLSEAGWKIV